MYLVGFALGWLGARAHAKQPWSRIKPRARRRHRVLLRARRDHRRPHRLHADLRGLSELASPIRSASSKCGRAACRFTAASSACSSRCGSTAARIKQPFFVVTDFVAPWTAFGLVRRAHRQLHQRRAVGQADEPRCAVGRHRRRPSAPPEPALRGVPRGRGAVRRAVALYAESRGRRWRRRLVPDRLRRRADSSSSSCACRISRSAISRSAG